MIDQYTTCTRSARRIWSGCIRQLFRTLSLQDHTAAADVSESLAVFCEQHPQLSGHTLSLLLARSFCAAGDREAAGRILLHDRTHSAHADTWLEVLSSEYPFPELYPLFSSRTLRPLRLHTVGGQPVWVMDLGKIAFSESDRHEIILLQTLRVLIEKIASVWRKADGNGTLVVKGLSGVSRILFPRSHCPEKQTLDNLRDILRAVAERNGWVSVPSILLLDL